MTICVPLTMSEYQKPSLAALNTRKVIAMQVGNMFFPSPDAASGRGTWGGVSDSNWLRLLSKPHLPRP